MPSVIVYYYYISILLSMDFVFLSRPPKFVYMSISTEMCHNLALRFVLSVYIFWSAPHPPSSLPKRKTERRQPQWFNNGISGLWALDTDPPPNFLVPWSQPSPLSHVPAPPTPNRKTKNGKFCAHPLKRHIF